MRSDFSIIGENIHASRVVKKNSPRIREGRLCFDGGVLPLQEDGAREVRPFVVAANLLLHGDAEEQRAAGHFVASVARAQTAAGADWLDINVDECGADTDARCAVMRRFAGIALAASPLPLVIDAAQPEVLEAGVEACRASRRDALLNSVTPATTRALELAARHGSGVILLPLTVDGAVPASAAARCEVMRALLACAADAGVAPSRCYADPVVMPVATDPRAAMVTLETLRLYRAEFGSIHVTGGVSNVSYAMPARAIINRAFARLWFEAGADAAILDPLSVRREDMASPRPACGLARALLDGVDEYGMAFVEAFRDGHL